MLWHTVYMYLPTYMHYAYKVTRMQIKNMEHMQT